MISVHIWKRCGCQHLGCHIYRVCRADFCCVCDYLLFDVRHFVQCFLIILVCVLARYQMYNFIVSTTMTETRECAMSLLSLGQQKACRL